MNRFKSETSAFSKYTRPKWQLSSGLLNDKNKIQEQQKFISEKNSQKMSS